MIEMKLNEIKLNVGRTIRFSHTYSKNAPYEWNLLNQDINNAQFISEIRRRLLAITRPTINSHYGVFNVEGIKKLTSYAWISVHSISTDLDTNSIAAYAFIYVGAVAWWHRGHARGLSIIFSVEKQLIQGIFEENLNTGPNPHEGSILFPARMDMYASQFPVRRPVDT